MKYYLGHKVVKAAKVAEVVVGRDAVVLVDQYGHSHCYNQAAEYERLRGARVGDYLVVYEDGYTSLSPEVPFGNGYTELPKTDQALAVMVKAIRYQTVTGVELQIEADTFDHYMASFDVGYPVEATIHNCKEPKSVKEGDVLVTYPTGRAEFLTREDFERYFKDAPSQIKDEELPKVVDVFFTGDRYLERILPVGLRPLALKDHQIEILGVYDAGGDELGFDKYEVARLTKKSPHELTVTASNENGPGRIVGYLNPILNRVEFSHGIVGIKARLTF